MKVSAISQMSSDEQRRIMFIRFSNSFMSSPETEDPVEKASAVSQKMGIENLEAFKIYPKEVRDGKTVLTA